MMLSNTYLFRYLLATLNANEGNKINTVANKSLMSVSLRTESGLSGPEDVKTTNIPIIPKTMDE